MKRKDYHKPTMQVVRLQQHPQLLQASAQSTVTASRNGYGSANTQTWDDVQ